MHPLRIAFLPLIRTTFDVPLAEDMIRQARASLLAAGFILDGPAEPVTSLEQAQAAARALQSQPPDMLLVFQATFADSTLVTALAAACDTPLLLWAVPEPWSGGRLRLNSLCGVTLAGHALALRGRQYEWVCASPNDAGALRQARALAKAGALRRGLQGACLGVVGEHPDGLDTCRLDESALLAQFGVRVRRIGLDEVFARARRIPPAELRAVRAALEGHLSNLAELEQAPLEGTLSAFLALRSIAREQGLDGLAVRCWPEFFTQLGCAACGAMSLLSDGFQMPAPLPCSCEADINGTLTQWMLQALSGSPAFGTDIVALDAPGDRVALWHCGLAPLSMAEPGVEARGALHSNRKLPLVMDFPLKAGAVTLARVSQAGGGLRLVYGRGQMLAEPKPFSGTAGVLRPAGGAGPFFERWMRAGLEHHLSLVYGYYVLELRAFARLVGLPELDLDA